jgi:magnesium transporter
MTTVYYSTARSAGLEKVDAVRAGAWVHVVAPDEKELEALAKDHGLEIDLLKDAIDLYESPRVERDDGTVYVYTRYYHPDNGVINATEPMLIIYKPNCIVTILRVDSPILSPLIHSKEPVVTTQKTKTLLQILEAVNSSYQGYVTQVTRRIFSVRSQLHRTDISNETLLGFIETEDDLNEFLSALQPQSAMLRNLLGGKYIRLYEEDKDLVEDLSLGTAELIELVKSRLKTIVNIREAYDALAANELNRTFKRLTSISIFLMIPTVFSGLYGMNVDLPLAGNAQAFSIVLLLVLLSSLAIVYVFRKKRWL